MKNLALNIAMPSGAKAPPRTILRSQWAFGDCVLIDGDTSLVGRVTAFSWRDGASETVEISWIHNGTAQIAWMQPYRLSLAE